MNEVAERIARELTKEQILKELRPYVEAEAKRKKVPEWSIVGHLLGHGSGVSAELYENYIKKKD